MENQIEQFINAILETRKVWLLQAREGFFAMLEDDHGDSYVPVWESEESAKKAAQGDWESYTVADMGFSELNHWLKELANDEIDIAVAPEKDGEITALASANFGKWVSQYADDSYKEEDDELDDENFDYGDGWAQPWQ
jgi:hypothetical protein